MIPPIIINNMEEEEEEEQEEEGEGGGTYEEDLVMGVIGQQRRVGHMRIASNAATLGVNMSGAIAVLDSKGNTISWVEADRRFITSQAVVAPTPREGGGGVWTPGGPLMPGGGGGGGRGGAFSSAALLESTAQEGDEAARLLLVTAAEEEAAEVVPEEPLPEVLDKDMLSWQEWRGCTSSSMSSKTISVTFSSEPEDGNNQYSKTDSREIKFYKKFTGKGVRLRKFFRHKGGCAERLVRYEKASRRLCWNSQKWWAKDSGTIAFDDVLDVEQYQKIVWIKTLHLGELAFECRKEEEAGIFYSVLDHLLDERPASGGPAVGPESAPVGTITATTTTTTTTITTSLVAQPVLSLLAAPPLHAAGTGGSSGVGGEVTVGGAESTAATKPHTATFCSSVSGVMTGMGGGRGGVIGGRPEIGLEKGTSNKVQGGRQVVKIRSHEHAKSLVRTKTAEMLSASPSH